MGLPTDETTIGRLSRYAQILEEEAIPSGFLGPREAPRILPRHVLESASLVRVLPRDGPLIDVGSGAGLPGMVLACMRADPTTLLESLDRRADFLRRTARVLGVDASVLVARAEDAARAELRGSFAAATARALAPPPVTMELVVPFLAVGGVMATLVTPALKSPTPGGADPPTPSGAVRDVREDESARPARAGGQSAAEPSLHTPSQAEIDLFVARMEPVADQLGGGDLRVVPLEVPGADGPRWAMIVNKLRTTPDRFPRRTGLPARRPLG